MSLCQFFIISNLVQRKTFVFMRPRVHWSEKIQNKGVCFVFMHT